MMSAGEVAAHLLRCCGALADFEAFMFGSALRGGGHDIDILIVGPPGDALSRLKGEMSVAGDELPLHIIYMQPLEEHRTNFVVRERCVSLIELAAARDARQSSSYP